MSNGDFQLLNIDKKDRRYEKVWMAAMNPKEFQRLLRFENCEPISVPSLCGEIAEKLNEDASHLLAADFTQETLKPMRSFLVASQFFIGLVYVHERQVKFLYDLVSVCSIPTKFLIEDENIVPESEFGEDVDPLPTRRTSTKGLKRKRSAKMQSSSKRKISLTIDTSDDHDDIEAQNSKTFDLLQNSLVSKNADISIREPEPLPVNECNEFTYCVDMPFYEELPGPERNDDVGVTSNGLLEDEMMSMTLNELPDVAEDVAIPTDVYESSTGFHDTTATEHAEQPATVLEEDVPELNIAIHSTGDDSIEMTTLAPPISNTSFRKRKRTGRNQPLIDVTLSVNVKENVKTVETTQRQLYSKDDSVSTATCLRNLTHKIFVKPTHTAFSESMTRQFESKSMSDKLLHAFRRMTLTRTEQTNRDMVQEFCSDLLSNNQQSVTSMPIDDPVADVPSHCDQLNELLLPEVELSVDGRNSQPIDDHTFVTVAPSYDIAVEPSIYEHVPVEIPLSIRQLLIHNETVQPTTARYDTDSQKQFASRSRQNKLDWGIEGVLQKLMSLWNSDMYPIGMEELMQSNNQRISAATAFFSLMELNSARVGLIAITKCPDSNVIFHIAKSPKLVELQEVL